MSDDSPFNIYLQSSSTSTRDTKQKQQKNPPPIDEDSEIHLLEKEIASCEHAIEQNMTKAYLLAAQIKHTDVLFDSLNKLSDRMSVSTAEHKSREMSVSEGAHLKRSLTVDENGNAPSLESSAMRAVRETCEHLMPRRQETSFSASDDVEVFLMVSWHPC